MKLSAFADDVTALVKTEEDISKLIDHFTQFGKISGLKLNLDKTVVVHITNGIQKTKLDTKTLEKVQVKPWVKITGIYQGPQQHVKDLEKLNFEDVMEKMQKKSEKNKRKYQKKISKTCIIISVT